MRGKQLAVPSMPERVSAFTIAETGDQQALNFVASYQVRDPQGGAIYVSVGPDDQLWMTSTALRRFTISRDSLLPDKQEAAVGLAAQPLAVFGDSLFVARRAPQRRDAGHRHQRGRSEQRAGDPPPNVVMLYLGNRQPQSQCHFRLTRLQGCILPFHRRAASALP